MEGSSPSAPRCLLGRLATGTWRAHLGADRSRRRGVRVRGGAATCGVGGRLLGPPRPHVSDAEGDNAALVQRLRNSLLNTVLFYDLMLASQGAEALGSDVNRIGEAVDLGRWFRETMGLRVSVFARNGWREVARIGDTGPIAWEEVAIVVPVPEGDELRIRLSFLVDA